MSVNYTAYTFIGAEVPDTHFYEEGEEIYSCLSHGTQPKKFCGDCGCECNREVEELWTSAMKDAAKQYSSTPEELWEQIEEDGGMYFGTDRFKIGFWRFGYERDQILFGTAISKKSDDDIHGTDKDTISPDDLGKRLVEVVGAFRVFGIKAPIKIWAIQDCG